VVNFAAESHVDRSIDGPAAFIQTNVVGTLACWKRCAITGSRLDGAAEGAFRFLHVSTDEVYGSLGETGKFTETTPYAPNSPYSASKAASDHLVRAFHHTYGLPVLTTNCSQQLRPVPLPGEAHPAGDRQGAGRRAAAGLRRRQAGARLAVRGDHCRRSARCWRRAGWARPTTSAAMPRCRTSRWCTRSARLLDQRRPRQDGQPRASQITYVADPPGHDRRYAIDASKLQRRTGLGAGIDLRARHRRTVDWYLDNQDWVRRVLDGSYRLERIGAPDPA
jgi:dTDP-glucose 4,6-dehydratase